MSKTSLPRSPSLVILSLVLVAALLLPVQAVAKGCIESAPGQSKTVPRALWGSLQSVGVLGDSTSFDGTALPDSHFPQYTSVDVQNGFLFASYFAGFQIFDLRSDPVQPTRTVTIDGYKGHFLQWVPGASEIDQFVYALHAPEGDDSILAVGGIAPVGLSIWDTRNKSAPVILYQDGYTKHFQQVWAATINGRAYAFGAAFSGENGVFVYDMTEARNHTRCLEDVSSGVRNCPGVYIGRVGSANPSQYVHGLQLNGHTYLVKSAGLLPPHQVEIWDVSTPGSPSLVVSGYTGRSDFTAGVALWSQGSTAYLAVHTVDHVLVHNVTACLTGGCASLPAPINSGFPTARIAESDNWKSIIFSRAGSTPMLFVGNNDLCHQDSVVAGQFGHTEYLLDMSDPANPTDVTPKGTISDPVGDPNLTPEPVDYWSWYYSDYTRGFAFTAPRGAKFYNAPNGDKFLYRADMTLLDVHKYVGGADTPPTANFTWTDPVYAGDNVTFTDTSIGAVTSHNWTFQPDGNPSTSQATSPAVVFPSSGPKTVTLTVGTNPEATASKQVTVIDPRPAVQGVTNEASVPVCGTVNWTANGVTGRPPLTITWSIKNQAAQSVASGSGNPFAWNTTAQVPGTYTGVVTVSNGQGAPATKTGTVTLTKPDPLPQAGTFTPGNDPFAASTVKLHANVPEATSWSWDFGDGQGYRSDAYNVADPVFTYTAKGTYAVKVKVHNCVQPVDVESAPLTVTITQVQPVVVNLFQAECNFGTCAFGVGDTVTFDQDVAGSPNQLLYDWDGNGTWDQTVNVTRQPDATITHVYSQAGTYSPKIRAIRGTEPPVDATHSPFTVSNSAPPPPPTITVGGPTSGNIGQGLAFTASATNCTASAGGWSWNTAGGTLSGSGSAVTITWASAGNRTISATNTGCSGTTGFLSVSITDGSGGGGGGGGGDTGGMTASFTFSPASPIEGQAVSFDGSGSTGTPTIYSWDFGDGQTASTAKASHAYAQSGTYTVKLEVSKPSPSCSFGLCSTSTKATVVVTGGAPPLQATFESSAACIADFVGFRCAADVGTAVSFTATTQNVTSYSWSFGDGGTASGLAATHTWTQPGTFNVQLTVSDGRSSASATYIFLVSGQAVDGKKAVILPWIAQTRGALVQTSDLYLLNPATAPMDVTLSFIRRGNTPETNPPKVTRTIQPGATLYAADVLRQLFSREDVAGFVTVNVDKGSVEPVITAFNTTVQPSGKSFGQTLQGLSMSTTGSAASGAAQIQNLIGLADNSDLLASFGVSNPGQAVVSYTMRLFDKLGKQIGTPRDFVVAQNGQRQFLPSQIQSLFGVTNQDDYRVEVRNNSGLIFPFSANLRAGSNDPSYTGAGAAAPKRVYLIGALSAPDANKHLWESDVVLSNTSTDVVLTDVSYIGTGVSAKPTAPVHLTLQPGETRRLADVIGQQWGLRNTVGVITLDSDAPGGVFPIVQGESYDSTNPPTKRFGQLMSAVGSPQAAGPNASQYLVGLRQDAKNRSLLWVLNPGSQACVVDIVYRALDGHELGRIPGVAMGPGIVRQFGPAQHKLPAGGVASGFTVQVLVKSGKVLAAAQVTNSASNDPAYILGVTR